MNEHLHALELVNSLVAPDVATILHDVIDHRVNKICRGEYDESMLESVLDWLNSVVLGWLRLVLPSHNTAAEQIHEGAL